MKSILTYAAIIDTVLARFPEIQAHEVCQSRIEEPADLPYLFFPAFWQLLALCLTGAINDNRLLNDIFDFMEDMATSDDAALVDLVTIEMLEPLFGLPYGIYRNVVKRHLRPKTLELHRSLLPFFHTPKPTTHYTHKEDNP